MHGLASLYSGPPASITTGLSVANFGAIGDGIADDTAALQRAINAAVPGTTISFGAKTYLISGLISNIANVFFNCWGTTFKLKANSSTFMLKLTANGQRVSGGYWDGNKAAGQTVPTGYEQAAVAVVGADDCTIDGVYCINSAGLGIISSDGLRTIIRDCRILAPAYHGIYCEAKTKNVTGLNIYGNHVDVSDNTLPNGGGISIASNYASGFWAKRYRIIDNNVLGATTSVPTGNLLIYARASEGIINGNTTNGGRMSLSLDSNQRSSVTGNTFISPSECCIEVVGSLSIQQSLYNTISGNTCIGGTYNIEASTSLGYTTVTGNNLQGASSIAVYFDGNGTVFNGVVISSNTISGAPTPISLRFVNDAVISGNNIMGTDPTFANAKPAFDIETQASKIVIVGNTVRDCQYALNFFSPSVTAISDLIMSGNTFDVATVSVITGSATWGANVKIMNNTRSAGSGWNTDYVDRLNNILKQTDNSFNDPTGNLSAGVGSEYHSLASGRVYFKQAGTGNSGWVGASSGASIGTVSTTYSMGATDDMMEADATSAAFTITIPAAASYRGRLVTITKIDATANAITIAAAGGSVRGTTSLTTQWQVGRWRSDGTNWIPA
jgi:hypothetical protein